MRPLPEIPDDDSDFTPELARKIIVKYQEEIDRLRSIAANRMSLFKQAASKVEEADALLLAFVAAYEQQDADNLTDAMRNVYAAADLFISPHTQHQRGDQS